MQWPASRMILRQENPGLCVANPRQGQHLCMTSSENGPQDEKATKSLVSAIDDFGHALKSEARKAQRKSVEASSKWSSIGHIVLSASCYMAFLVYRAYRGVFVLSPLIYRRVYVKLEEAVMSDIPRTSDSDSDDLSTVGWRTRLTTTIIASIVVVSYLLSGLLRGISTFFKTMIANKKSVSQSFEATIEEIELFSKQHQSD